MVIKTIEWCYTERACFKVHRVKHFVYGIQKSMKDETWEPRYLKPQIFNFGFTKIKGCSEYNTFFFISYTYSFTINTFYGNFL